VNLPALSFKSYANAPCGVPKSPGVVVMEIAYGFPFLAAFSEDFENAGIAAEYIVSLNSVS